MMMANSLRRGGRAVVIALPLAFLGVFFYYPLAGLIERGLTDPSGVTLERVAQILSDSYLQRVFLFTIEQALLSMLGSVALGVPLAYVLVTYDFPGRRLLRSLTIVPFALPAITVALGFILMFGNNGALNRGLMALFGLQSPPLAILYSLSGIILAHAFYNAPIVIRFVAAAWERLDPAYEESARALGAPPGRVFLHITWPMLAPALISGATLAFIYSFLSFPIVLTLGGALYTTVEVEIYRRAIVQIDYTGAAALATIQLLIALVFTLGYLVIEGSYARRLRLGALRRVQPLFAGLRSLLDVRRCGIYLFLLGAALFFVGPIAAVVFDSVTRTWQTQTIFTLDWYRAVFSPSYSPLIAASPLQSVGNSLSIAGVVMLLAFGLGAILATKLARGRLRGRRLWEAVAMAPLAISSVALGLALLRAFVRPPLEISGTWMAIVIAHAILAIPFVIRAIRPSLERLETNLYEAARGLGASPVRAMLDVLLPLIRGSLLAAAIFAFAISIAETSATLLLTPPGLLTMPIAVYYLLASRQFGAASAMSVLMILVIALSFVLVERLGERTLRA
jgi:thiamine transport system permease protein